MIEILTALVLGAAAPACNPVKGADTLWAAAETRWVFIGEMHGTNEAPEAFVNLVCLAAAKRGPVTVALEFPIDMQAIIDAWMASDGGEDAKAALLAAPDWRDPYQSGRTSVAFLRMFEQLRRLKATGAVRSVRVFDVKSDWSEKDERNTLMAAHLTAIANETKALTLVLVGNIHAARHPFMLGPEEYRSAAFYLPENQRITVVMTAPGGSAWGCRREGCRAYSDPVGPSRPVGLTSDMSPEHRYDFTYDLGKPTTAAPPAIPGIAATTP
jgi:hypothetical protein